MFIILFLLPAFLLYTVFMIVPIFYSFFLSLSDWNGIASPKLIGIANYLELFKDSNFWLVIKNTFVLLFTGLFIKIPLALALAYLVTRVKKVQFKIYRTVFFFPMIFAPIAIGLMFSLMYHSEIGLLNKFLDIFGLSFLKTSWLSNPDIVLYSVTVPEVWHTLGLYFIILLAGILAIPNDLFESAQLDGASQFRIFFNIVIPMVWSIIEVCIVLSVTGAFKAFEVPWAITEGGPGFASAYNTVYMFKMSFVSYQFGYGSAIAVSVTAFVIVLMALFKRYSNKYGSF